jgi:patatin-like phospholipase/acyl hydrolase
MLIRIPELFKNVNSKQTFYKYVDGYIQKNHPGFQRVKVKGMNVYIKKIDGGI